MATAWSRCLSILEYHDDQIPSASHAIRILNSIKNQVIGGSRGQSTIHVLASVVTNTDLFEVMTNGQGQLPSFHTPGSVGNGSAVHTPLNLNLEDGDFFGAENLTEAWYGQQLINLDWLDFPQQQFSQPVQTY